MSDDQSNLLAQLRINRPPQPHRTFFLAAVLIGMAVLAGGGAGAWFWWQNHGVVAIKSVPVRTMTTGASVEASMLDASGYVVAYRQATVASKILGRVDQVPVEEGQQVKAGQLLAKLDDSDARALRDQAAAALTQTQAALAQAKRALADIAPIEKRDEAEAAKGLISSEAMEQDRAGYDRTQTGETVQQANVAAAQAALQYAEVELDNTTVKAPFDGIVTAKNVQPGEIISPLGTGSFTRSGIVTLVDMSSLEAQVDVSETYIDRVALGQKVGITLNAYADWQIPGRVIAIVPTVDETTATVKVRIALGRKDTRILPGMGLHVSFLEADPVGSVSTTMLVSHDAIQGSGESGGVFVIEGDHVTSRQVNLGARSGDDQIILGGLAAGENLAIGDFSKLRDGTKVKVVP